MGAGATTDRASRNLYKRQIYERVAAKLAEEDYDLQRQSDLYRFLADANIKLVEERFLRKLHSEGRPWSRRQEAEQEAAASEEPVFWDMEASRVRLVVAVSHVWETREHPDPYRHQLTLLVRWMDLHPTPAGIPRAFFIDFMSLYQYMRTAQQEPSFRRAMRAMQVLYAHDYSETWRIQSLTPAEEAAKQRAAGLEVAVYDQAAGCVRPKPLSELKANHVAYERRGWCQAEVQWSNSGSRPSSHAIDGAPETEYFRKAPMPPEVFKARVDKEELVFTHRGDSQPVLELQAKVFVGKAAKLQHLSLADLAAEEVSVLGSALKHYKNLKQLHLHHCQFRAAESVALAAGLAVSTAEEWHLKSCGSLLPLSQALVEAGERSGFQSLKRLLADCNDLNDSEVKAFAAAIQMCPSLQHVELPKNGIGDIGAQALADVVKTTTSLMSLDLRENCISDAGAEALVAALKTRTAFDYLRLCQNSIGDVGLQALAETLPCTGLQGFCLRKNCVGDTGAQALAAAIATSNSLKVVFLDGNSIGDAGAQALAQSIQKSSVLEQLHLPHNKIGDLGGKALAEAMAASTSLKLLVVAGNDAIGGVVQEELRNASMALQAKSMNTSVVW